MTRFRAVVVISGMVLGLCLSARAQKDPGQAEAKHDAVQLSLNANAGASEPGNVQANDLRTQIQQLREMILQQNQQIAAQQTTIKEQQDKMDALAAAVAAEKAGNPATIQPAVYAANSALAAPQVRPAAGFTPPDNSPKIGMGVTIFPNFTYQEHPTATDADGNVIRKNSFDVSRAYINFTGNISHVIAFRITPDIARESSSGPSLSGSNVFRLKYAYLQANLDEWTTRGTYVKFGLQQTPWIDYEEGIYRYRFQGPTFVDRAGYLASSDYGAGFHYNFAKNYGDFQVGVYNGEGYSKAEANDHKAFQIRASFRPLAAGAPIGRGFRVSIFYDGDNYVAGGERRRLIANTTFEHKYLNMGFDFLDAHDQTSGKAGTPDVEARGFSFWATPRTKMGLEALFRFDHLTPNTSSAFVTGSTAPNATTTFDSQTQSRMIFGLAYWFPHEGSVSSALMVDWDAQIFRNIATTQPVRVLGVHALINY
jgi:Phosphate-selective porin O and P